MWNLKTEQLKSSYVLDDLGTKKIIQAVNQVDLEIQENEVYGIAGESGCGKTTLMKTLLGEIEPPLKLISGKVRYRVDEKDVDLLSLRPAEIRRYRWKFISYISQSSMSVLNPVVKIQESFLEFGGGYRPNKKKDEVIEIARQHLVELGLPPRILKSYPHQLSGGMRQRTIIALASFLYPQVLIADEPVTALDVVVLRGVLQLLKEIQMKLKATIILITHDMGVLANIADRIGIMYAGRIVEEAKTEQIFEEPLHPYTKFLINSLPQIGDKAILKSAPGAPPSLADLPHGCAFHPRCPHAMEICAQEVPEFRNVGNQQKAACWLISRDKKNDKNS